MIAAIQSITRLSTDINDYSFVDTFLAPVNLNSVQVDVIDFGSGVAAVMAFIVSDVHNWVGTAPFSFSSILFPANPLLDNVLGIGTVFGGATFTQTAGLGPGSAILSPRGANALVFEVGSNTQPENNFCNWAGQFFFLYS